MMTNTIRSVGRYFRPAKDFQEALRLERTRPQGEGRNATLIWMEGFGKRCISVWFAVGAIGVSCAVLGFLLRKTDLGYGAMMLTVLAGVMCGQALSCYVQASRTVEAKVRK